MDVRMPGLDGCEACARLRRHGDGQHTPVLMMSCWGDDESVDRAYGAGATDFQTKPLNWRVLRQRVSYMIGAKQTADELRLLAHRDGLTGLANRTQFRTRLDHAIAAASCQGTFLGVIFFDLDGFKQINDTLGHRAGDQVLQAIGRRLVRELRSGDVLLHTSNLEKELAIGRMGGDEFTILAPNLPGAAAATKLADRIRDLLKDPVDLDGVSVPVAASASA